MDGETARDTGSYGDAATLVEALAPRFGERITTSVAVRDAHGSGEGLSGNCPPDAVVFPESTEEVAEIVRACTDARVPIVPFGVGTSLEGHVQAIHGGITIDLSKMDRIISVGEGDLDCHIEAGVTREGLNAHLRDKGLFFPLDPGANATLGGMAATRASGTNAVRYGTMREVTLGLTVVTPDARTIRTGGRARKSSSGYDLTRLFVGSEGTLGVITELRLRLFGIPETIASGVCQFGELGDAVDSVTAILQVGIPVARIELLDEVQMSACIAYSKLEGFAARPTLFFELHGSPASVADQRAAISEMLGSFGGGEPRWAEVQEERSVLWKARHDAYWAARALAPGKHSFATDACVPISRLSDCILETKAEAAETGLICPIVGHVGDGNFHVLILFDDAERERAEALATSIARRAIRHGGTATGEHGIGLHKLPLLEEEHGTDAVGVMRAIKRALDPANLMNPGKTIPDA